MSQDEENKKRSQRLLQKREKGLVPPLCPIPPNTPPAQVLASTPPPLSDLLNAKGKGRKRKRPSDWNKDYRERMKADPEKYQEYLESNRERNKEYREKVKNDEQLRKRHNELAKIRMANMRERKRKEKEAENAPKKMKTRHDEDKDEEQREKWRLQKQKQREKMIPQKRAAVNKKKRQKRLEDNLKRLAAEQAKNCKSAASQTSSDVIPVMNATPAAKRQALCLARKAMPSNAEMFAETLVQLQAKASPKKKKVPTATLR